MTPERRQYPRVPYELKLKEFSQLPDGKVAGKGVGKDLSIGGMRIVCSQYITEGLLVRIKFSLPWDLGVVTTEGRVQWVVKREDQVEIGVKFLQPRMEHVKSIERYIQESRGRGKEESFLVKIISIFRR